MRAFLRTGGLAHGEADEAAQAATAAERGGGESATGGGNAADEERTAVVGFFEAADGVEEDEYEEFAEAAAAMHLRADVRFGVALGADLAAEARSTAPLRLSLFL